MSLMLSMLSISSMYKSHDELYKSRLPPLTECKRLYINKFIENHQELTKAFHNILPTPELLDLYDKYMEHQIEILWAYFLYSWYRNYYEHEYNSYKTSKLPEWKECPYRPITKNLNSIWDVWPEFKNTTDELNEYYKKICFKFEFSIFFTYNELHKKILKYLEK